MIFRARAIFCLAFIISSSLGRMYKKFFSYKLKVDDRLLFALLLCFAAGYCSIRKEFSLQQTPPPPLPFFVSRQPCAVHCDEDDEQVNQQQQGKCVRDVAQNKQILNLLSLFFFLKNYYYYSYCYYYSGGKKRCTTLSSSYFCLFLSLCIYAQFGLNFSGVLNYFIIFSLHKDQYFFLVRVRLCTTQQSRCGFQNLVTFIEVFPFFYLCCCADETTIN